MIILDFDVVKQQITSITFLWNGQNLSTRMYFQ